MLDPDAMAWLQRQFKSAVRFDESMARHTSFRIGGPADALVAPETERELERLIQWARSTDTPYLVIGGGTNLLVRDGGVRGLVIHLGRMALSAQWQQRGRKVWLTAAAGLPTRRICALALKNGWQGMNFALGIPGTLGGAIWVNAGTASGSMAERLHALTLISGRGEKMRLTHSRISSGYRQLNLPASVAGDSRHPVILLTAELALIAGRREAVRREAKALMQARARKQPSWQPSAGCYFKNPPQGRAAGALIDAAGLKGTRVGDAVISDRHANFIVNSGHATARDVLELTARIRETVRARFQIDLKPEVRVVGEE